MPAKSRKRFALTVLFVVVWCAGLEILTRVFLTSPSNVLPDSAIGYLYAPDSSALVETADAGFLQASFNELGLNDWPIRPDDHRPRVVVLGDSYVEAFQVPRSQSLVGVMGHDRPDLRFVNGGRSGMDPVTELLMLEKLAPLVNPVGVIVVVNAGDNADMSADGITLARCKGSFEICDYHIRPLREIGHDLISRVARRSALCTYLARRFEVSVRSLAARAGMPTAQAAVPGTSALRGDAYSPQDFAPLLSLVFRRISARYRLIVVAIPDIEFEPGRKAAIVGGGAFERTVGGAAATAGAAFFDAGPALVTAYARSGQPPRGFAFQQPGLGHLNAAGHAAVAHGIEDYLEHPALKIAG